MKLHYLNKKDFLERKNFCKEESKYVFLKSFFKDKRVDFKIRFILRGRFIYYKYLESKLKIRSRCLLTGRSRFVLRYVKLSRMSFRDKASRGFLCGFKKY